MMRPMSTRGPDPKASNDKIRVTIRHHHEPFITAVDVAEQLGVARQTAYKYLQRLHDGGELNKRKIGGSAVIWWYDE